MRQRQRPEQVSASLPDGDASADQLQELLIDLQDRTGDRSSPVNVTVEFADPEWFGITEFGVASRYFNRSTRTYFYTFKFMRDSFEEMTEEGNDLSTLVTELLGITEDDYEQAGIVGVILSNGK